MIITCGFIFVWNSFVFLIVYCHYIVSIQMLNNYNEYSEKKELILFSNDHDNESNHYFTLYFTLWFPIVKYFLYVLIGKGVSYHRLKQKKLRSIVWMWIGHKLINWKNPISIDFKPILLKYLKFENNNRKNNKNKAY